MNILIKILSKQPNTIFFTSLLCILFYNLKEIFLTKKSFLNFFILTPIMWTLQEYLAHFLLMHKINKLKILHMKHHRDPKDKKKIFIPILFTSLFGTINILILYIFTDKSTLIINFSGNIICYLLFEYAHYISHENKNIYFLNELKIFHLMHHNKVNEEYTNFGFTSASWDIIFNTINKKYYNNKYYYILLIPYPVLPFILFKFIKQI